MFKPEIPTFQFPCCSYLPITGTLPSNPSSSIKRTASSNDTAPLDVKRCRSKASSAAAHSTWGFQHGDVGRGFCWRFLLTPKTLKHQLSIVCVDTNMWCFFLILHNFGSVTPTKFNKLRTPLLDKRYFTNCKLRLKKTSKPPTTSRRCG